MGDSNKPGKGPAADGSSSPPIIVEPTASPPVVIVTAAAAAPPPTTKHTELPEGATENENNKPVPMTGDRRPSDPTDFTERKTSLIYGEKIHIVEPPPPVKKAFEIDFWICTGLLFLLAVLNILVLVVIISVGDSDKRSFKNTIGPKRDTYSKF